MGFFTRMPARSIRAELRHVGDLPGDDARADRVDTVAGRLDVDPAVVGAERRPDLPGSARGVPRHSLFLVQARGQELDQGHDFSDAFRVAISASAHVRCCGMPVGLRMMAGMPQDTHGCGGPVRFHPSSCVSSVAHRAMGGVGMPYAGAPAGTGSGGESRQ
jgi:hypothetical protein